MGDEARVPTPEGVDAIPDLARIGITVCCPSCTWEGDSGATSVSHGRCPGCGHAVVEKARAASPPGREGVVRAVNPEAMAALFRELPTEEQVAILGRELRRGWLRP